MSRFLDNSSSSQNVLKFCLLKTINVKPYAAFNFLFDITLSSWFPLYLLHCEASFAYDTLTASDWFKHFYKSCQQWHHIPSVVLRHVHVWHPYFCTYSKLYRSASVQKRSNYYLPCYHRCFKSFLKMWNTYSVEIPISLCCSAFRSFPPEHVSHDCFSVYKTRCILLHSI